MFPDPDVTRVGPQRRLSAYERRVRRDYDFVLRRAYRVGWRVARQEYLCRELERGRPREDVDGDVFTFELLKDLATSTGSNPVVDRRLIDVRRASWCVAVPLSCLLCALLTRLDLPRTAVVFACLFIAVLIRGSVMAWGLRTP